MSLARVFIWGLGEYAQTVYEAIDIKECVFCGFIDGDKDKQKELWKGLYPVSAPEVALARGVDYVLISVRSAVPIEKQAVLLGYDKRKLIRFWEDNLDYCFISELYLLKRENDYLKSRLENAPYEFGALPSPIVKDSLELLRLIETKRVSLARYGDGEFEMMRGNNRPWFQHASRKLADRLREILNSNNPRVIIAIADNFGDLSAYKKKAADGIREYLSLETRREIYQMIDLRRVYYNAYVTRPYYIYQDKTYAKRVFEGFQRIWKKRDVIIVEGRKARIGINNDLFDGAEQIRRIICPEKEAFKVCDDIRIAVKKHVHGNELVLVSLGPTATILAYDLGLEGIQTIDIGQLDTEYEWFLNSATDREEIPGKSVAELSWWHDPEINDDDVYLDQIIERVGV